MVYKVLIRRLQNIFQEWRVSVMDSNKVLVDLEQLLQLLSDQKNENVQKGQQRY